MICMYKKNEPSPWNFGVHNCEPLPIRRAILSGVVLPFTWNPHFLRSALGKAADWKQHVDDIPLWSLVNGLRENLNRKPMGFYHPIGWALSRKFSHHPILWYENNKSMSLAVQVAILDLVIAHVNCFMWVTLGLSENMVPKNHVVSHHVSIWFPMSRSDNHFGGNHSSILGPRSIYIYILALYGLTMGQSWCS